MSFNRIRSCAGIDKAFVTTGAGRVDVADAHRSIPRSFISFADVLGESALGRARIHGELLKLGIKVPETAVATTMIKRGGPPSQAWRTFLVNHVNETIALDFFAVPTATFRVLFVLITLSHDQRGILHVNATEHPTAL